MDMLLATVLPPGPHRSDDLLLLFVLSAIWLAFLLVKLRQAQVKGRLLRRRRNLR